MVENTIIVVECGKAQQSIAEWFMDNFGRPLDDIPAFTEEDSARYASAILQILADACIDSSLDQ